MYNKTFNAFNYTHYLVDYSIHLKLFYQLVISNVYLYFILITSHIHYIRKVYFIGEIILTKVFILYIIVTTSKSL